MVCNRLPRDPCKLYSRLWTDIWLYGDRAHHACWRQALLQYGSAPDASLSLVC